MLFEAAVAWGRLLRQADIISGMPLRDQLRLLFAKAYPVCVIAILVVSWIWTMGDRRRIEDILDGAETVGVVAWSEPAWSGRFGYSYSIGSGQFAGVAAGTAKAGSTVRVRFAPGNPGSSCVCDPGAELRRYRLIPLVAGLWGGLIVPALAAVLLQVLARK